jgi:hypothetical protein
MAYLQQQAAITTAPKTKNTGLTARVVLCPAASESWNPTMVQDSVVHDRAASEAEGGVMGPSSTEGLPAASAAAAAATAEAPAVSTEDLPAGLLADQQQQQEEQLQMQVEGETVGESAPVPEQFGAVAAAEAAEPGGDNMQLAHRCGSAEVMAFKVCWLLCAISM